MREYIVPILSIIVGVVVLLPTAVGPIARPFVMSWMLPIFVTSAILSVAGLAIALVASGWATTGKRLMHVGHGIGNFSGIFSLILIAIFLGVNYFEDTSSAPRILNIKVNPVQPEVNKVIELDVDVFNRTNESLVYDWKFENQKFSGFRTAYIKMPAQAGNYILSVSVRPAAAKSKKLKFSPSEDETFEKFSTAQLKLEVIDEQKTTTPLVSTPKCIFQIHNERQKDVTVRRITTQRTRNSPTLKSSTQGCF